MRRASDSDATGPVVVGDSNVLSRANMMEQSGSYSTWRQLAGYFDGDGSVTVYVGKFTMAFYLDWSDQYRPQLNQIEDFLKRQGIRTGRSHKMSVGSAWIFRIAEESVITVAENMIPHCFKKQEELQLLLNYREHQSVTDNQVIIRLNELVKLGKREKHREPRVASVPWTFDEGLHLSKQLAGRIRAKKHPPLTSSQEESLRDNRNLFGFSQQRLAEMFGVSRDTVQKVLRGG